MTHEFTKTVAFKAVDEENRTATGAVLVPNEVDRQRDFLRPDGVEAMFAEDPDDGVMHAAFPDGAADLTRSEIVDEPVELNGESYPAGTWVATRKYADDDLWQLVEDGVLTGFSIGGRVQEVREYESGDVPDDVTFPDDVTMGSATEIVDGEVNEVSDVDIPAVPRATYRELSKLGKSITEEVSDESEFVELMRERGHDEADARDLWSYLQTHKTAKVNVAGTEVDLTPPESMVNAAEAAAEAGTAGLISGDCGTGVGDRRRDQIRDGELGPEVVREIAAYLHSHEADVTADGPPSTWTDDEWASCGNAQYAKWGGTGGGEPHEWAMRRVNEIDAAREEDPTYPDIQNMTEKAEYAVDEWVTWPRLGGDSRGQVVEVIEEPGEGFSDAISGDVSVEAEEDNPVYLLEVWDGTGEDASPREDEAGRGDTMHVANREDRLRSVSNPTELSAKDADGGLVERMKSALPFMAPTTDDAGNSVEDAAKAGRTLSQRNRRAAMAAIDAQLDLLTDAGVDHEMTRFTDRADFAFNIEEYGEKGTDGDEEEMDKDAPAGDTADTDTDMSNDDTDTEKASEPPAWAESLVDKVESIEKRVDDMDDDADTEKTLDDAPEWASDLAEKVDGLDDRVDAVSKATADTQQTGGAEQTGGDDLSDAEKAKRSIFLPNGGD